MIYVITYPIYPTFLAIGNIRNGRCKRHGGASTGPISQASGKSHHRYVHGLRTREVVAIRRLLVEMNKSFKEIIELT